jgi:hypothetical protein
LFAASFRLGIDLVHWFRGALEAVLSRGRVFEKLENEFEELRKKERKSEEAAALFKSSRVEAGTSRAQAILLIETMLLLSDWLACRLSADYSGHGSSRAAARSKRATAMTARCVPAACSRRSGITVKARNKAFTPLRCSAFAVREGRLHHQSHHSVSAARARSEPGVNANLG